MARTLLHGIAFALSMTISEARPTWNYDFLLDPLKEIEGSIPKTHLMSWYGPHFQGHLMASGLKFDQNKFIAAHKSLPFGTRLILENPANGKKVLVQVLDYGPVGYPKREYDVSRAVARKLGFEKEGLARILVSRMDTGEYI